MPVRPADGGPGRGPSDPRRVVATLDRHGVDFVLIGGYAVIAHGSTRTTQDVDFVADTSSENLERLAAALAELGAELWGVDAHMLGIDPTDPHDLAAGGNFTLTTAAGGVDFFKEVPGAVPYDDLRRRALEVDFGDADVRVAALDDLIEMKRAAGRPQDLRDIAALTATPRTDRADDDLEL